MSPREGAANTADPAVSDIDVLSVDADDGSRREYRLATHFQPIFSLAHRRPVGLEALIRGTDANGKMYLPAELLAQAPAGVARMQLDRQCRALHVRNFRRLRDDVSWLFLNVDPHIAVQGQRFGSFAQMLAENSLSPHRVAVELIETPFDDQKRLITAVEHYHELGCLVVIDDFGAGYSNFDRIWQLKPDIVKIDREMTRRVTVEPLARRMFTGIISVLHEAALVMRAMMIVAGTALIRSFSWVLYLFGAFLLYAGAHMLFAKEREMHPEQSPVFQFASQRLRMTKGFRAERFFVREGGRRLATPLFLVLLVVEITDVTFALDSIPAVFGITRDPFIVYTSNVFAILGLRSLYFLLAGVLQYFRFLSTGLSFVLLFIGAKMLAEPWLHVPAPAALGVVAGILAVALAASWLAGPAKIEPAPTHPGNSDD